MKILMFSWEFPPLIAGGLAMACYGMVKSLLKLGVEVDLVLPTKEMVYFAFRKPEDADTLPVRFLDPEQQTIFTRRFIVENVETLTEKLQYVGMTTYPETYISAAELRTWSYIVEHTYAIHHRSENLEQQIFRNLSYYLSGEEDIFKKVQEMAARAHRFASELKYDLIHAHDWLCYPAGIIAKKISGKPLFTHMHATEFDRAGGYGDIRIHNIENDGLAYSDMAICVSKYTANMVISKYGVDTAKIRVLHNAFAVEDIPEKQKRIFKGPTILFLGRITIQKGPDYYVDVAERIIKKHPQARFIMAGSGDMFKKLLYKTANIRLKNRFIFAGFLNRTQVEEIFNSVDIFIMPSVSEPFGIVPLEAMAYGVAAVISKTSGVSEVIENAYKVDFWDIDEMTRILDYLITNPKKRKELGEAGRQEVLQIGWDDVATKLKEYYGELYDK
jgi:hypothetical protein